MKDIFLGKLQPLLLSRDSFPNWPSEAEFGQSLPDLHPKGLQNREHSEFNDIFLTVYQWCLSLAFPPEWKQKDI